MREDVSRVRCESADKVCYGSKHDARKSLTGQLKSKSVRIYRCPSCHEYHLTKEWKSKHLDKQHRR